MKREPIWRKAKSVGNRSGRYAVLSRRDEQSDNGKTKVVLKGFKRGGLI
nr:hypothetical protein [Aestuariispira ectoiniformans]